MLTDQQKNALSMVCDLALKSGGIQAMSAVTILLQLVQPPPANPTPPAPERVAGNGQEAPKAA